MDTILYIPIAISVLILIFIILKLQMKKIAKKDLNRQLLQKRGTDEDYYFQNEQTGKIYLLKTSSGELYHCLNGKNEFSNKKFSQIVVDLKYSGNVNDFEKLTDNYYELIEKDIYFNINDL
jgi:hypothetical protein